MRKKPELALTPQTSKALENIVLAVADEYECHHSYLYAILSDNGTAADPYAHFRKLFRALCRVAPARARIYLDDINQIFDKLALKQVKRSDFHVQHGLASQKLGKIVTDLRGRGMEELSRAEREQLAKDLREASQCIYTAETLVAETLDSKPVADEGGLSVQGVGG